MEALLRGKEVVCLGAPFYSNWGLTDDRQIVDRRNRQRSLIELFTISYILFPIYIDVHTLNKSTPEEGILNLANDYNSIMILENEDQTFNSISMFKAISFKINNRLKRLFT